jgi:serine/threonine protein kinase
MSQGYLSDDDTLDLPARERIDRACLAFEDSWKSGRHPQIESLLKPAVEPERSSLFAELLMLELFYRKRHGERPTPHEYEERFPHDVPLIREAFQRSAALAADVETVTYRPSILAETDVDRSGRKIGRYTVQRLLGSGGFGSVYLAWDDVLKRQVAIKVLRRDGFHSDDDIENFLNEARTVAKLDHSGIVPVYDAGRQEDGSPFVVMKYVDGRSLAEVLRGDRPSPKQAVEWMIEVAEAVGYAHRRGYVHRDLKPANILIDSAGTPYVADFGLAVHASQQRQRKGELSGTVAYMAPEQVRGEVDRLDGRADIWALGVILYELLAGQRPFSGDSHTDVTDEILNRPLRPPRQIDDTIPPELERICQRCLAKPVTERYASAADLAKDLRRWQHPRRRLFMAAAAIGLLVILPASLLAAWRVTDNKPLPPTNRLSGDIEVLIWDGQDQRRRGLGLREPGALPLKTNDQIRVAAQLNRPAYVYLVWIGTNGEALPVYPWPSGDWTQRPARQSPTDHIRLPEQADIGWPLEGGPGMETLLLLARETPLPDDIDLAQLLAALPPQTMQHARSLVEFQNGAVINQIQRKDRSPQFFNAQQIDDPVLQTQQLIQQELTPHFPLIRAVSFANQGP